MMPGETFTAEVVRGRLTIPPSIRKTLRIKDYTSLQVTVEKVNGAPIVEKKCILCNLEVLISEASLINKKILEMDKPLSEYFSEVMSKETKMQVFEKDFKLYHLEDKSPILCWDCYISIIVTVRRRLIRAIRSAKVYG